MKLPCRFCGGVPVARSCDNIGGGRLVYYKCPRCNQRTCESQSGKVEALKYWNEENMR